MLRWKALTVIFLTLLIGCGGGGDSDVAPERPIGTADGYGVDAVVANASVAAYSWKNGVKGSLLGNAVTDEYGYYNMTIQAPAQPVLLELSGGYYIEEASDQRVNLSADQKMYAVTNYGGGDLNIMITPFTTIAAGLAQYYAEEQGENAPNAITLATSEITGITVFNIMTEYPINITYDTNHTTEMTDGHMYGFYAAAFSSWTAEISEENGTRPHNPYTSINITDLMYRDVLYDGVLNGHGITGNGRPGRLSMGVVELNAETYRLKIAQHVIIAAAADYNRSGLTTDDVLEHAHTFSQRVNALYGFESPLPLDAEGPRVYQLEPLGRYYRGEIDYAFRIVDIVGINSMSVSMDGNPLECQTPTGTTADLTVHIDTGQYTDGEHHIEVVSTDLLQNESTHTITLFTNNTGVLINIDSDLSLNRHAAIEVAGSYELTGTTIDSITVNGDPALISQNDQRFSYLLYLDEGYNDVSVVGTDTIGNQTEVTATIPVDYTWPEIITNDDHGYHRFYLLDGSGGNFTLHDENTGYPLYFDYYNTSLNNLPLDHVELLSAEIPFFTLIVNDPEGEGVFTIDENMTVEMRYVLHGQEVSQRALYPVEDTTNKYFIPLVTEYLTDQFLQTDVDDIHTINVRAFDEAGNSIAKILTFKAFIDAPDLTLTTLNNRSTVRVYSWENGTKGGIITEGRTETDGTAQLRLFADAGPILIELSDGRFEEIGTGGNVRMQEGNTLKTVVYFDRQSLSVNVTPLTHVMASAAQSLIALGHPAQDAINAANENLSATYGFDILTAGIANISDANSATTICSDEYRHAFTLAGLSRWSHEAGQQNGAIDQSYYNSILLADKMAADIADNLLLDGGQYFGAVAINQSTYQTGFGESIAEAVAFYSNTTNLTLADFVGSELTVVDAAEAVQAFGVAFEQRETTINREINTVDYEVSNRSGSPLYLKVDDISDQSTCDHEYYDAVREHILRRHRDLRYRGRTWTPMRPFYMGTPNDNFYGWQIITKYEFWQNDRWTEVNLPATEAINIYHDSDTMPADGYHDWEYFITENVGELKNYTLDDIDGRTDWPVNSATGSRADLPKYEWVFDYYMPEYQHPVVANGDMTENQKHWYKKAWGLSIEYTGPHQTSQYGDWTLSASQLQYLTTYLDREVTPQIQRDYLESYTVVQAPHNVVTERYSENHPFQGSRFTVVNGQGQSVPQTNGQYVIPANGSIVIKKYVTTPAITVNSHGSITYAPNVFDESIAYNIDKDIALSVSQGGTADLQNQMPTYEMSSIGNATYTLTR